MTLLMFNHAHDGHLVLTDTLATSAAGQPHLFQTKCWPLPHLNMVMVGTGSGNLFEAWYRTLQTSMLVRDIDNLDFHAPRVLRDLWDRVQSDHGSQVGTSTVYHFGFSSHGVAIRYVYRSTNNFESELADEPGFGVKPQPLGPFDPPGTFEDFVELAKMIRHEQDALPPPQGVYVGGDLIATSLESHITTTAVVYRWDDYDVLWESMAQRLADDA